MTFLDTSNVPAAFRPLVTLWTEERVETLKRLWGDGYSASQIAGHFDCGISRSAVIGKVHRLQLEPRRVTIRMPDLDHNRPHRRVRFKSAKPLPPIDPQMLAGEPAARPVYSVNDLKRAHCRWPCGDPGTEEFHFCGGEALDRRSYCGPHHRIAYQPNR